MFYHIHNGPGLTDTTYTNSWGPALQVGADIRIAPNWYINLDVKKIYIETTAHTSKGAARVSTKVHLDPYPNFVRSTIKPIQINDLRFKKTFRVTTT